MAESPVLYLQRGADVEGAGPALDVWAGAYVPYPRVVITREQASPRPFRPP